MAVADTTLNPLDDSQVDPTKPKATATPQAATPPTTTPAPGIQPVTPSAGGVPASPTPTADPTVTSMVPNTAPDPSWDTLSPYNQQPLSTSTAQLTTDPTTARHAAPPPPLATGGISSTGAGGPFVGAGGVPAPPVSPVDPTTTAAKTPNNPADPSTWVNGVDPSTPHFDSAQLIANQAGGNMTAQGTSSNAFTGYKDPTGGGSFGGYGSEYGADAPLVASMANGDSTAMAKGLDSSNPKVADLAAQVISQQLSQGGADRAGLLAKLTPAQREKVGAYYQDTTKNIYNADQAYYDKNRAQNGALYKDDWATLMRQLANKSGTSPSITTAGTEAQGAASVARGGYVEPNAGRWTPSPDANTTAPGAGQTGGTPGTDPTNGGGKPAGTEGILAGPGTSPTTTGTGVTPPPVSTVGGPAATATDPTKALTAQTLSVGPTADRYKIAQDQFDTFQKASDPAYQASLRDAMRYGAAGGGLGSGQLRTSLGDLQSNRATQMDTQRNSFLQNALTGSIDDAYKNLSQADQQQGFQNQQQQQAFNQSVTGTQLQDNLTNSSFSRALQALTAGSQGNPSDTQLTLSQIFGNQATGAGNSLAQLIAGLSQKNTAAQGTAGTNGLDYNTLMQLIQNGMK